LGKVSNDCIKLADLKQSTYYADLNWDLLIKWYSDKFSIKEISKFPEVRRDLSLVLDKKVTFAEINALALKTEKKLLQRLNVFDVYEGANLGENKKSYSVSFILQDNETLTDQQIDAVMTKLISTFEKELDAVIRK